MSTTLIFRRTAGMATGRIDERRHAHHEIIAALRFELLHYP